MTGPAADEQHTPRGPGAPGQSLPDLLAIAVRAARLGGQTLLRHTTTTLIGHKSSETDPVTTADLASQSAIATLLAELRPEDGLLGEEEDERAGSTGLRWVVDPLDGTTNFLYGLPCFAVSVACQRSATPTRDPGRADWQTLVGAVNDPRRGEIFTAALSAGARLNGRPIAVNDPVPLATALIATGFAYGARARAKQAATVSALLPMARDIRSHGSAALDLCWLAAGRCDAYYEDELAPWDWAAGALIAREAGATVSALGTGLLAAGPALHPRLAATVSVTRRSGWCRCQSQ
ncbi:MAG: inositol monophosphatase [Micromonosporaceae bacterium]|nr:inositol monophosphatase [Micromonosporaceae bacterium]